MASYSECVQRVVDAAGGTISKTEAEEILQGIADEAERLKREGKAAGAEEQLRGFAKAAGERKKIEAALAKKHAVLSALKHQRAMTQLQRMRGAGLSWTDSFLALMHGMNKRAEGVRNSVQATIQAYESRYLGTVMARISKEKPHLERTLWRTDWRGRPTQECLDFNNRIIKEMEQPGSTKDADAAFVAKVFGETAEVARRDLNRLGAFIGQLEGQGWFPHSHDADRMIKVSETQWVDDIIAELDLEKTYKGLEEDFVREHLRELYRTIITGQDLAPTARSRGEAGFRAPANMAKSLGEQRFLHFKNSDAWIRYNSKYGKGTATAAIFEHLQSSARYAGMMDTLGPNPEAMLGRLADEVQRKIRNDRGVAQKDAASVIGALKNIADWPAWRVLSGKAAIPGQSQLKVGYGDYAFHVDAEKFGAGARAWEQASKLTGAVLSALPTDPAILVSNLRFQGKPLLEAWGQVIRGYFRGRGKDEERHLAFLLGEGYDGLIGQSTARYAAADTMVGRFSRMSHLIFKYQGLTGFTDLGRSTAARIMAADMGHHTGFTWANLPPRYRNVLELQGIGEAQWDALRQARHEGKGGTWYLSPDNIARLPDSAIDPLIRDRLDDAAKAVQAREKQLREQTEREAGWVAKRTAKFQERFRRSRDYLESVRAKMDTAAQKRADALQERIDALGERLSEVAEAYDALAGGKKPGISRRVGRDEGKLGERAKNLAKAAKDIERELGKRQAELGHPYLKAWQKWQKDLQIFVDRMEAYRQAREAELGGLPERLRRRVAALREEARVSLEVSYRRFIADEAGFGIVEADARSSKWATGGGLQKGTWGGEAARFMFQFKGFPIAFSQRVLGRKLQSGPDHGSRAANILHGSLHMGEFMATLFVAGLLGSWLKDVSKGRDPRSLVSEDGSVNLATISNAFMQGGGLGIYGDFLFGEFNRFNRGAFETLAGPFIGDMSDLIGFLETVKGGEPRASRALQLVLGNTPFINFWATRAALDYLFISSLREWASPGYLARQEKKMREEYGQERVLEPLRPFG